MNPREGLTDKYLRSVRIWAYTLSSAGDMRLLHGLVTAVEAALCKCSCALNKLNKLRQTPRCLGIKPVRLSACLMHNSGKSSLHICCVCWLLVLYMDFFFLLCVMRPSYFTISNWSEFFLHGPLGNARWGKLRNHVLLWDVQNDLRAGRCCVELWEREVTWGKSSRYHLV